MTTTHAPLPPSIGVDMGGTSIKFAVVQGANILHKADPLPTAEYASPEAILEAVAARVRELRELCPSACAVGMGLPGFVAKDRKTVARLTNYENCDGLALGAAVERRLAERGIRAKAAIENDANCAALGEGIAGEAAGMEDYVVLTLGTGVGAGIIVDGHLLKGKSGAAGEMHFPVDSGHKRVCSGCGMFDCFESFASGTGLNANAREYMGAEATSYDVIRGLKEGDHQARAAFDKWQDYLIKGLIMVANVFDPEVIVLSGSMAKFVEYDKVSREVNGRILTQPFELKEAAFENNAGMIGAALLLIARIK